MSIPRLSKRQKETQEEEVSRRSEKYYDEEGDLVISDGIVFRIHAYRLQASSGVFRAMIKLGMGRPDQVLKLHDPDIETEAVINLVLGISFHNLSVFDYSAALRVKAIKFVRKYDMELEFQSMCAQAHLYHGGEHWSVEGILDHFTFAFQLELYQLCRHMVVWVGPLWHMDCRRVVVSSAYGSHYSKKVDPFCIDSLSLEQYQRIPAEIAWVLTRATMRHIYDLEGVDGEINWLEVARDFEDAIRHRPSGSICE